MAEPLTRTTGNQAVSGNSRVSQGSSQAVNISSTANSPASTFGSPVRLLQGAVAEFKDRRHRRRVPVAPMYTFANVQVLAWQGDPLEGHVIDLSESGMAIQVDEQIAAGHLVTVEFSIVGLGCQRQDRWPTFRIAAEVVRMDDLADFPGGPYRTALRFVRISTMVQAPIARFVMMQPAQAAPSDPHS